MPAIYYKMVLHADVRAYRYLSSTSRVRLNAGLFSIPKHLIDRDYDMQIEHVHIVDSDKVWKAIQKTTHTPSSITRVVVRCVDVTHRQFAKELLMTQFLLGE